MDDEELISTIDKYGTKIWKNKSEELHRIDGPAIEYRDGTKCWYKNGLYHRIDGPAYESVSGIKVWYYRDKRFKTKEDFFDALTEEEKAIALFSKDFHNA